MFERLRAFISGEKVVDRAPAYSDRGQGQVSLGQTALIEQADKDLALSLQLRALGVPTPGAFEIQHKPFTAEGCTFDTREKPAAYVTGETISQGQHTVESGGGLPGRQGASVTQSIPQLAPPPGRLDINYGPADLTLLELAANAHARSPRIFPRSNKWTLMEWAGCCVSEAGEMFNKLKKLDRDEGDLTEGERQVLRLEAADEAADTLAYLLQTCERAGFDLYAAYVRKHNLVCAKQVARGGVNYILPDPGRPVLRAPAQ